MCCILTISDNCYNQSHPGDAFFCGPLNSVAHVVGGCYYYRPCISQLNQSASSHKLAFLKCKPLLLTFFLKKGLNDKVMSHEIMKYTWICFYLSLRLWKQLLSVSSLRCELTTVMIFTRTGLSALMQSHWRLHRHILESEVTQFLLYTESGVKPTSSNCRKRKCLNPPTWWVLCPGLILSIVTLSH